MNAYAENFIKKEEHSAASCKIGGDGQFEHDDSNYTVGKGDGAALAGRGRSVFLPAAWCC